MHRSARHPGPRTLLALAMASLAAWAASQTDAPPGPEVVVRSDFPDAHRTHVVHLVLDFAPGAWTPPHTHGGMVYVTVLEGTMTVREEGREERTYDAGGTWLEFPGIFAEVGNTGDTDARIFATFLLPEGAAITGLRGDGGSADAPPGPTTAFRSDFRDTAPLAEFDVVQMVLAFAPEAWTPVHTHGGEAFVTVLSGEMTMRMETGSETRYGPGDQWLEVPGEYAAVGNAGDDDATIAVTFLLPRGAEVTTTR